MLTDKHIKQFQTLWEKRFGNKISKEEAYEKGVKLVQFMELVYKSMVNENQQQQKKRHEATGNPPASTPHELC